MTDPVVIDQYTFLDYKGEFGKGHLDDPVEFWVGEENMRRLRAYMILESYYRNNSREFLNTENVPDPEDEKANRREYGDPFIVVETALSSLLGDDQSIRVPGAEGKTSGPEVEYLKKLLEWAEKERLFQKVEACERSAVKVGDGVYALGWNEKLGRPRLEVWDPGFYFPVWDEEDPSEEFSQIVHIAYDFIRKDSEGKDERFLRRITWELVDLIPEDADDEEADPVALTDRPWNGQETTQTCLMSDMTWKYEDVSKDQSEGPVYTLDLSKAYEIRMEEVDLEIDWIPVVHITNTDTDSGDRFGISVLSPILQIVDDLIGTDTDLQAAAATTGAPPLVIPELLTDGAGDGSIKTYGPGEVLVTGGDGKGAELIDTSKSLDALIKLTDKLLSRMSVNGRIPESLLGRVKPNEVPSGIALTLSFSPHSSMVKAMRMVRKPKYALLLKMVGRFLQQNGDVAEIFPAELHFGSFLPADKQEVMTMITQLYDKKLISLETCIVMMIEAGFPIDEVQEEVKKIQSRDFESAGALNAVSGDVNDGRKYLGLAPITVDETVENPEDPEAQPVEEDDFPVQ